MMAFKTNSPVFTPVQLAAFLKAKNLIYPVLCQVREEATPALLPKSMKLFVSLEQELETFGKQVKETGPPNDDVLALCYETAGVHVASQVWWKLKCLGRAKVAVLDGGLRAWNTFPESSEVTFLSSFDSKKTDKYCVSSPCIKTEEEVNELQQLSGWLHQILSTDPVHSGLWSFFDLSLIFTSTNQLEEPSFLKEILLTAGINLSEGCQTIVFGAQASTLLLALSLAGKQNLCLGIRNSAPHRSRSIDSSEFYTARGEDDFFDASSARSSKKPLEIKSLEASLKVDKRKGVITDMKRQVPNSNAGQGSVLDDRSVDSCRCLVI